MTRAVAGLHPVVRRSIHTQVLMMVPLALVIAGCSATPDTESTTSMAATSSTTEATVQVTTPAEQAALQYQQDVDLITQLWWDQNLAWAGGFESGISFWVDNNYPDLQCEYDDYVAGQFPDGPVDGLVVERLVNAPTIVRDDGWIIPGGLVAGSEAKGRVYVMDVRTDRSSRDSGAISSRDGSLHATVLDGRAHFFFGC